MRSEYVVQVLLLVTVVFTFTGNVQSQEIAIELDAGIRIAHDNRRVIDPQEEFVRGLVPLGQSLVRRELQDFHRMSVWVLEVERRDSRCILVPIGESLRSRRSV